MSYFSDQYKELRYPIYSENAPGLRNAQLGAVHAIASFHTLGKKRAGIIVMPTGSGKTAVIMMTPYLLCSKKTLIVTPSVMVRGQICEDFCNLSVLKKVGVLPDTTMLPVVYEMSNIFSEEHREVIESADVVITSPKCGLSLSEDRIKDKFDLVLIDEAHHSPAPTWERMLINMNAEHVFLFTATPFRMDKKDISGEIIFTYPLSMAFRDKIFGEIQYIPIEEAADKDFLIAREAERVLLSDRQRGYAHYLMVRTDTKDRAKVLEEIYESETQLKLKRIDSTMAYSTIKKCICDLRNKTIDGIICVDMLGEGFDFPNLKIAAIHDPQKSLATTLQFIGRFARTNAENLGVAKFIAMNNRDLVIENSHLYTSDSIWQEIIIDMSERRIHKEEANKKNIEKYTRDVGNDVEEDAISLHSIRPNCHAKIFSISGFNIEGEFPAIYNIGDNVFRNRDDNTVVGIGKLKIRPQWLNTDNAFDIQNLLYIVHFQKETSLLFVYSQTKNEMDYETIAQAFTTDYDKIPRNEIHRVLGDLQAHEMFNTGMQSRFSESGESYRIYAGSNVASSIDPVTGRMYAAGHVFCKALSDGNAVTIGYSSGSKIWSSSYLLIPEYVQWCNLNGKKIVNNNLVVKTYTNYDYMPLPTRLDKYPQETFYCFLSYATYATPPVILDSEGNPSAFLLTDASIIIETVTDNYIEVIISIQDTSEKLRCNIDGTYVSRMPKLRLRDGRINIHLADYFNGCPLIFKTLDDATITGNEICIGNPSLVVFNRENIVKVDWGKYNTDKTRECGEVVGGLKSVQGVLKEILLSKEDIDYIIYDHTQGEIADYITIKDSDNEVNVVLYHVKAMKGDNYNSNLADIYEVTQQAIKSLIWMKSREILLDKIRDRRKTGNCSMIKGNFNEVENILSKFKKLVTAIAVVQPAISYSSQMPEKFQEVLASAEYYIKNSGVAKKLELWGSE